MIDSQFQDKKQPYNQSKGAFGNGVVTKREHIYPPLSNFFTFLNIYMERQVFDKMKESMETFRLFIIQFLARQTDITAQDQFRELGLDKISYKIQPRPLTEVKV